MRISGSKKAVLFCKKEPKNSCKLAYGVGWVAPSQPTNNPREATPSPRGPIDKSLFASFSSEKEDSSLSRA
jgi:hypothetical protein